MLLRILESYERNTNADKLEFVTDCKARIFCILSLFLQHPLSENMSLAFSKASDSVVLKRV